MTDWVFPPTRLAALQRIAAVRPGEYARSRNAIEGAVSGLSPYITHGVVSLPEVLAAVAARYPLTVQHKWVFELGWREYFHHVWAHRGDGILRSVHAGPRPDSSYQQDLPRDIREAATGVPVIDAAVRALYATGYLHNHARMWLASYVVHLRHVHWRAGADWLVAHLLDGDLASNHLSWQWVAGTGSHKPYLFNADNVARYAPASWHSPGSVIDTSYAALDAVARGHNPVPTPPHLHGVAEPALQSSPRDELGSPPQPVDLAARDVWLVHPWALGEPPTNLPAGCLRLGWWPAEHHAAWPWSEARWDFVGARMAALASQIWCTDSATLTTALRHARSVRTQANPHAAPWLPDVVVQEPAPMLFAPVDRLCPSFSVWWRRSTEGLRCLSDLSSLAHTSPCPIIHPSESP